MEAEAKFARLRLQGPIKGLDLGANLASASTSLVTISLRHICYVLLIYNIDIIKDHEYMNVHDKYILMEQLDPMMMQY